MHHWRLLSDIARSPVARARSDLGYFYAIEKLPAAGTTFAPLIAVPRPTFGAKSLSFAKIANGPSFNTTAKTG